MSTRSTAAPRTRTPRATPGRVGATPSWPPAPRCGRRVPQRQHSQCSRQRPQAPQLKNRRRR
eukprot:11869646-Alexandrium_andersonii.AAC.1